MRPDLLAILVALLMALGEAMKADSYRYLAAHLSPVRFELPDVLDGIPCVSTGLPKSLVPLEVHSTILIARRVTGRAFHEPRGSFSCALPVSHARAFV